MKRITYPARLLGRASYLAIATLCLAAPAAFAQERSKPESDTIVVTGTAVPIEQEKIGNSLTVVSSEQIQDGGYTYVPDVLRQVPGLAVSRTSAYGGLTEVRIRGAEGNHTVVLFNGVDVSDAGQGETDLSTLLSVNIDRIEVLRGPQSGLYGSNALAGVINILTRKSVDGPYYNGSAEYGSFNATTLMGGGGTGNGVYSVDGGVGLLHTDGIDTSPLGAILGAPGVTGDKEGNENGTGYISAGYKVSPILRFDGFARYVNSHAELDGFAFNFVPGQQGLTYDDASESFTHSYNLFGSSTLSLLDDHWVTVLSASYTRNHAEGKDGIDGDQYGDKAYRTKYAIQSSFKFGSDVFLSTITGFAESKKEWYQNTHPSPFSSPLQALPVDRNLVGVGAQYQAEIANQLYLSAVIRHDDNDKFEDDTTYSMAASWVLKSGTRPHASYGTGVTNPSFYEQFGFDPGSFVGNPNLKPERAWGWDAGVEQTFANGVAVADVTYFKSTLRDEIISCFPSTCNASGKSPREGVELSAHVYPARQIDLIGSYTYLDAKEGSPPTVEVRRPKNQAALDANWRTLEDKLQLTLGVTYNGDQYDNDFRQYGLPNFVALKTKEDGYTLVRLAAAYRFRPNIELFARVENLFDEDYEEVIGSLTPGRTAYVGIRFSDGKAK